MASSHPRDPIKPMPRFLTPSTICLLALISVYTDAVVPSSSMISVLSFLVSQLRPLSAKDENLGSYILTIESFQKATITLASSVPGRTIWDLLLKKLWEIDSFDALYSFFDALAEDSSPKSIVLSRRSLLGRFVARAQLEFKILVFESGVSLWKGLINYRASTLALWQRRHPTAGKSSYDINLQSAGIGLDAQLVEHVYGDITGNRDHRGGSVSIHDIAQLLEYQITRVQKMGIRVSQPMKDQFRNMLGAGSLTIPHKTYLLGCLDAWKSGDQSSALDSLHRYFDYAIHIRNPTYFQHALLNLTILQADFGCLSEAVEVIKETISTARRNNDARCLNICLGWLYQFGKAHPEEMKEVLQESGIPPDQKTIAILKATARSNKMWGLLCTSLLSEARFILGGGGSVLRAFKCVLKASHMNVRKHMPHTTSSQMMMQWSLYSRLGVTCQSLLHLDIFLQCYAKNCHVSDSVQIYCRSALSLSRKGHYDQAFARMEAVDELALRTLKSYQLWTATLGILKAQQYLHRYNIPVSFLVAPTLTDKLNRDNLVAAERVLSKIQDIPIVGQDLHFSLEILKIDLHMRRQDYSEALATLETFANKLHDEKSDISHQVYVMVLKARILDKAGTPQKGFSVVVRAARTARRAFLLRGLWEAISALSRVLISIKEFEAATKLLEVIMPPLLEYDDCHLTGRSYCHLADAHVGMAGDSEPGSIQRKERLAKALEYIDRSFDEFSRIEDLQGQCETTAKKATIMYLNGDLVLANDCAAKYLDIKKAAKEQNAES